jgi:hypothetical protein
VRGDTAGRRRVGSSADGCLWCPKVLGSITRCIDVALVRGGPPLPQRHDLTFACPDRGRLHRGAQPEGVAGVSCRVDADGAQAEAEPPCPEVGIEGSPGCQAEEWSRGGGGGAWSESEVRYDETRRSHPPTAAGGAGSPRKAGSLPGSWQGDGPCDAAQDPVQGRGEGRRIRETVEREPLEEACELL